MEECVEVIFPIDSDVSDSEDFQPEFLYDGDRAIKEEEDSPQFDIPLPNITGTESSGVGPVSQVTSPSENSGEELPGQAILPLAEENGTYSKPVPISPANRIQSPGVVPLIDRMILDPNVVYKVEQSSSGGVDPVYRVISATCPSGNSALQAEKEHPGQATLPLVSGSPGVVPLINRSIRDPKVFYKNILV